MVNCSFTGKNIPKGKGRMLIRNSGRVLYFINGKALKNFIKLGRKPLQTKWTNFYNKQKAVRLGGEKK